MSEPTARHASPRPAILGAIWAQTPQGVIGDEGAMPWHVPEDLAHFKRVTAGHPVIMGRKTWLSFPPKFRPLPGRSNIVLTGNLDAHQQLRTDGALPVSSIEQALEAARGSEGSEEIWVIGGANVYAQMLDRVDVAIVTKLNLQVGGDACAPQLGPEFSRSITDPEPDRWHTSSTGVEYRFETWIRSKD